MWYMCEQHAVEYPGMNQKHSGGMCNNKRVMLNNGTLL